MKYTDSYGDMWTRFINRPNVISKFFATSNIIDMHNQLQQDLLQLIKKWLTKKTFFRLTTTLLGVNVTDTFHLANHHRIINHISGTSSEKNITIQHFAGLLGFQLLQNAKHLGRPRQCFLP
jgi:Glu-tRNA(Gln) amidotransferase subunit E-like FAD-binding protein